MAKGTDFEISACNFLKSLFEELGFHVIEARRQVSGTQNGFDILIKFFDEYDKERNFHFECKDYETPLNWEKISIKILELSVTTYEVDCFFAVSPKIDISNIHHHLANDLPNKVNFPIKHWTPETCIMEYFALNQDIYKKIYGEDPPVIDKERTKQKIKTIIKNVLGHKDTLKFTGTIEIKEADREPEEDLELKTTLDRKLDSVYSKDDPLREKYHQRRCNYKIYLEELQDLNNQLRRDIIKWQENLGVKAERLTDNFRSDPKYSAKRFFHDFFKTAEDSLFVFMSNYNLRSDEQKLLEGVVFEIAAECKLNWSASKLEV